MLFRSKFPEMDSSEDLIDKGDYSIRVARAKSKKTENNNILVGFESMYLNRLIILGTNLDLVFDCAREDLDEQLALFYQKSHFKIRKRGAVKDFKEFKELVDVLMEDVVQVQAEGLESATDGHDIAG